MIMKINWLGIDLILVVFLIIDLFCFMEYVFREGKVGIMEYFFFFFKVLIGIDEYVFDK